MELDEPLSVSKGMLNPSPELCVDLIIIRWVILWYREVLVRRGGFLVPSGDGPLLLRIWGMVCSLTLLRTRLSWS